MAPAARWPAPPGAWPGPWRVEYDEVGRLRSATLAEAVQGAVDPVADHRGLRVRSAEPGGDGVETGSLDPDHIHTPGIFISGLIHVPNATKHIEQRTVRQKQTTGETR